jgi:hypothetical protein
MTVRDAAMVGLYEWALASADGETWLLVDGARCGTRNCTRAMSRTIVPPIATDVGAPN